MKISKSFWFVGLIFLILLFLFSAVIFEIWEFKIVPIELFGALTGVVVTAVVTLFLLQGQSNQEMRRETFVKIFEQKIHVYSEFTEKMWNMVHNDEVNKEKLLDLRSVCFDKLVFYLNNDQIKELNHYVKQINSNDLETTLEAISGITELLQKDLNKDNEEHHITAGELIRLYKAFAR